MAQHRDAALRKVKSLEVTGGRDGRDRRGWGRGGEGSERCLGWVMLGTLGFGQVFFGVWIFFFLVSHVFLNVFRSMFVCGPCVCG